LICGDNKIKASTPASLRLDIGANVWMRFAPQGIRIFDAESEKLLVNGSIW
jgi:hypothetical protein